MCVHVCMHGSKQAGFLDYFLEIFSSNTHFYLFVLCPPLFQALGFPSRISDREIY